MKKCVFFDRDGTINIDFGYVYQYEQFVFMPNVIEALDRLKKAGFLLIVITNQSGIARGKFSESDVDKLHNQINEELKEKKLKFDAFYYCPHYKDGIVKKYSIECNCRKPKPGLFLKAKEDFGIDMQHSYLIGNSQTDIMAAEAAGVGQSFLISECDISSAVDRIIKRDKGLF